MRKCQVFFAVTGLLLAQQSLANIASSTSNRASMHSCDKIAKACLNAGYTRNAKAGKEFWNDCMKPVLLNNTVKGIKLNMDDISACREAKIKKMKSELQEFTQVR